MRWDRTAARGRAANSAAEAGRCKRKSRRNGCCSCTNKKHPDAEEPHKERRSRVRTQQRQTLWCVLDLEVLGVGRLIAIYSWRLTKGRRRSQESAV